MFLKRLEMIGFKSFAERTEVEFVRGVTAVVGPNGSGKSNIADAVRWALGEQSARTLRGARMEDVIFAGSEARKGVSFCEVALTFDNADGRLPVDFGEVTVARRVYRSGDSEYLLNREPCRLRDIAELFMDTGVGREAYSIVGQGQIDEILSSRAEDRRGIFEEAAGIVKFKARRRETERRLAEAEQDHQRVRDILAELTAQLGPLRERAAVARRYQAIERQANALQIAILAAEVDASLARRDALATERETVWGALVLLREQSAAAQSEARACRMSAEAEDQRLEAAQSALLQATERVEQCEADRRVAFERQEHGLAQLEEWRRAQERLAGQLEAAERAETDALARADSLQAEASRLRERLEAALSADAGHARVIALRTGIAAARADLIERMREQAALRGEWKHTESGLAAARARHERTLAQVTVLDAECAQIEQREAAALSALESLREEGSRRSELISRLREAAAALERESADAGRESEQAEKTRVEMASRLAALSDMQQGLDGFAGGPRAVLLGAREKRLRGVRGAVADLIRVEEINQTAIETALGGALQHIVVESEGDARLAIDYLRKRQLGRATFLPLETIRGRRLPLHELQMVKGALGFVGVAADLVATDRDYRQVVDSLLGNVLVVTDLAEANRVARVLQHRVRVVTQSGDVVNPGGSMTGGSVSGRGASILGRAREIGMLAERVAEQAALAQAARLKSEESAERLRQKRAELATEQERTAELAVEFRGAEAAVARLRAEREGVRARREELSEEASRAEREALSLAGRLDELNILLARAESVARDAELAIAAREEALESEEASLRGRSDRLADQRVALAEREESLRGAQEALSVARQTLAGLHAERGRLESERSVALARQAELRSALEEAEHRGREAQKQRDALHAALLVLREERGDRLRELEELERRQNELGEALSRQEERLRAVEVAQSRADADAEARIQTLREEHGLGMELARSGYPLYGSILDARARLAEFRAALDAFGEVSVGAIEECERLEERLAFLTLQEGDLAEARAQLETLIAEIDEEMARRFCATFDAVRVKFQEVFTALFGGGRADIRISDERDPLHAGIEIFAEPPGKRMQSLTLLSGGERALTALTLLFAILGVRPVPFCVLDEVEAALDEANVARFARYLKSCAQDTQFVLITHRRGTMESADVLYGITMQESGVSKVVSVRVLDETESA